MGGMLRAVEEGYPQREIAESAYQYQKEIESGQRIIVGVNGFRSEGDAPIEILRIDETVARGQVERLRAVKAERDGARVAATLAVLERTTREGANVLPAVIDAVKAYATLGEISDVFRKVHGVYREDGRF
jgi:methylmalonyl-CoA mutase N-terminal domain/subunit